MSEFVIDPWAAGGPEQAASSPSNAAEERKREMPTGIPRSHPRGGITGDLGPTNQ